MEGGTQAPKVGHPEGWGGGNLGGPRYLGRGLDLSLPSVFGGSGQGGGGGAVVPQFPPPPPPLQCCGGCGWCWRTRCCGWSCPPPGPSPGLPWSCACPGGTWGGGGHRVWGGDIGPPPGGWEGERGDLGWGNRGTQGSGERVGGNWWMKGGPRCPEAGSGWGPKGLPPSPPHPGWSTRTRGGWTRAPLPCCTRGCASVTCGSSARSCPPAGPW